MLHRLRRQSAVRRNLKVVERLRGCPGCGVSQGCRHFDGCDALRCPACGSQRPVRGFRPDDFGALWTGLWPGR